MPKTIHYSPIVRKSEQLFNQRLYFDIGTLYGLFGQYLFPHVYENQPADPPKLEKCQEAMFLLDAFLHGKKYIAGDQLTVADLILVTSAVCYTVIDFDISKYENVDKWIKKVSSEAPKYDEIVGEGLKVYTEWINPLLKKPSAKI